MRLLESKTEKPKTMEAPADICWSSAANWTISNGSLHDIINFESSLNSQLDFHYYRKSPLILKPPSPDSFPCEIKISFPKKYEIRQVYVRSTARVYEIYYAPSLETSDEYLSTVRCNTAVREEELINANGEEGINAHSKGQNGHLIKVKCMRESTVGANEDDWVVVNFPDSPTLDNRDSSLIMNTSVSTRNIKDFYEATAEIKDVEPCMSLTLCFQSIQSEGCLYIDDVYVFALPIEPKYSSDQPIHTDYFEIGSKTRISTSLMNEFQRPDSNRERKLDGGAQNRLESLMEQFVVKLSNIEDLFLRFEENMVKPITSIEARLERVEQQLKVISLNSESIKAKVPEFSKDENSNEVLVDVSNAEGVNKPDQLYEGHFSSPFAQAKHYFRNEDYEVRDETHEREGYYGLLTGSKSIASGVQNREPIITLIKFHRLMDIICDGDMSLDMVGGGLQDNRTCFNQQLFAFPTEAVCSG